MRYFVHLFARAKVGADNVNGPGAALTAPDRDQHLIGGADMAQHTHTFTTEVKS